VNPERVGDVSGMVSSSLASMGPWALYLQWKSTRWARLARETRINGSIKLLRSVRFGPMAGIKLAFALWLLFPNQQHACSQERTLPSSHNIIPYPCLVSTIDYSSFALVRSVGNREHETVQD
jgi:hypothetical protein